MGIMKRETSSIKLFENPAALLKEIRLQALEDPTISVIIAETEEDLDKTLAINVDNETVRATGMALISHMKFKIKTIKEHMKIIKGKANEVHKGITGIENELTRRLIDNIKIVDAKISDYLVQEQQKREAERIKAEAKAAELERIAREKAEAKARKLEAAGKKEQAEAVLEAAEDIFIPAPIIQEPIDKTIQINGNSATSTSDFDIRVMGNKNILQHILNGTLPDACVKINEPAIKRALKADSTLMDLAASGKMPGIKIIPKFKTTSRAARTMP